MSQISDQAKRLKEPHTENDRLGYASDLSLQKMTLAQEARGSFWSLPSVRLVDHIIEQLGVFAKTGSRPSSSSL
jgi:hypothetical protein